MLLTFLKKQVIPLSKVSCSYSSAELLNAKSKAKDKTTNQTKIRETYLPVLLREIFIRNQSQTKYINLFFHKGA